jgi:hypothetical protein
MMAITRQPCARCAQPLSDKDVLEQRGWCESCRWSPISYPDRTLPPNIVDALALDDHARPTFLDLTDATTYHLFINRFDAEAIMPSIRTTDCRDRKFFFSRLLRTSDGRWFARGGFAASRDAWQNLVSRGFAYDEVLQIGPEQAAAFLMQAKIELPPELAAMVQAIALPKIVAHTREGRTNAGEAQALAEERKGTCSEGIDLPEASVGLPDLVTLDQAAALVNRSKSALRHYRAKGMPAPVVRGKKGQPNEYRLSEMLPWLEKTFNRRFPDVNLSKFRAPGRRMLDH